MTEQPPQCCCRRHGFNATGVPAPGRTLEEADITIPHRLHCGRPSWGLSCVMLGGSRRRVPHSTPGTVKLWVPPRQSRGVSPVYARFANPSPSRDRRLSFTYGTYTTSRGETMCKLVPDQPHRHRPGHYPHRHGVSRRGTARAAAGTAPNRRPAGHRCGDSPGQWDERSPHLRARLVLPFSRRNRRNAGKNGIGIVTDTVHLDLNGFALIGVSESLHGITLNNRRNVSVSNGTMRNFGGNGLQGTSSVNVRVQDVQVDSNGGWGVGFGDDESGVFGATIVRVVATGNGDTRHGRGSRWDLCSHRCRDLRVRGVSEHRRWSQGDLPSQYPRRGGIHLSAVLLLDPVVRDHPATRRAARRQRRGELSSTCAGMSRRRFGPYLGPPFRPWFPGSRLRRALRLTGPPGASACAGPAAMALA